MKIEVTKEIYRALKTNMPIVALESTIITHGMPYPENVNMARKVESVVRENGAIPATIAIINGVIKVGLTLDEIEFLAKASDVVKVSSRDLGYVISKKKNGGTTVATTSIIANSIGIKVFATGGIGGVHRNAQTTFDISNDLEVIANTDIIVVCAGAKAILDLNLTMEYLETKGVEVIGYKTDKLPSFYSKSSNIDVTYRLDSPYEIKQLANEKWGIKHGGIVVANPIPDKYSLDEKEIEDCIQKALEKANYEGIKGKKTTPFLLDEIVKISNGKSLEANKELVFNNARLAALIAREF